MSFANRATGKDVYVAFIHSGGTAVLTGDQTNFGWDDEMETADMSAGSDTSRVYKGTLLNFSASLETIYTGTAGTAAMYAARPGQAGTLIWGDLGTAAGKPKWGRPVLVTKHSTDEPFDDKIAVTIDFSPQGDYVFDGRSATW